MFKSTPAGPSIRTQVSAWFPNTRYNGRTALCWLTVGRKRVRCRTQTVEMITPLTIRLEFPSQIVIHLILRVLEIVLPVRGSLPDIDHSSSHRLLRHKIYHSPLHQRHLALVRAHYDTVAILAERGIGAPEGAEDGRRGGDFVSLGRKLVFDFVDEPAKK